MFPIPLIKNRTEPNPYHQITRNEYEPKILGSFPSLIFASQTFWGQKVKDQSRTASAWAGVDCELRCHDSDCLSVFLSVCLSLSLSLSSSIARLVTSCGWVNSAREATACHQVFVNNRDPPRSLVGRGHVPWALVQINWLSGVVRHGTQYTLNSWRSVPDKNLSSLDWPQLAWVDTGPESRVVGLFSRTRQYKSYAHSQNYSAVLAE